MYLRRNFGLDLRLSSSLRAKVQLLLPCVCALYALLSLVIYSTIVKEIFIRKIKRQKLCAQRRRRHSFFMSYVIGASGIRSCFMRALQPWQYSERKIHWCCNRETSGTCFAFQICAAHTNLFIPFVYAAARRYTYIYPLLSLSASQLHCGEFHSKDTHTHRDFAADGNSWQQKNWEKNISRKIVLRQRSWKMLTILWNLVKNVTWGRQEFLINGTLVYFFYFLSNEHLTNF